MCERESQLNANGNSYSLTVSVRESLLSVLRNFPLRSALFTSSLGNIMQGTGISHILCVLFVKELQWRRRVCGREEKERAGRE